MSVVQGWALPRGFHEIQCTNPLLATEILEQGYFIKDTQVPSIIAVNRLLLVLVRCGNGRFLCPVQDVQHFIAIIEKEGSDYVRDISLPSS